MRPAISVRARAQSRGIIARIFLSGFTAGGAESAREEAGPAIKGPPGAALTPSLRPAAVASMYNAIDFQLYQPPPPARPPLGRDLPAHQVPRDRRGVLPGGPHRSRGAISPIGEGHLPEEQFISGARSELRGRAPGLSRAIKRRAPAKLRPFP